MRNDIKAAMLKLKAEIVEPHEPCDGLGWFEPIEPGKLNPCKCMTVFHYLNALIEARIPRDYWWLEVDDLEIAEKYKVFCHWFNEQMANAVQHALGVLFLGANGIGKTSMQCAIGKEAIVQGYTVRYCTAQQYIEATKMSKDLSLLEDYESGQFILFDEIDKVYIKTKSNYVTKTLEDFLRRKTSQGAVLIICTNHNQETLAEVFGQSTMSMLRRHLKIFDVEGEDFSEKLQERWNSLMKTKTDYYADEIVSMAQRMMDRETEEDDIAWKKAYQ